MNAERLLSFTYLFHAHAKTCKRPPSECLVCRGAMRFFEGLPKRDLSFALEDRSQIVAKAPLPGARA